MALESCVYKVLGLMSIAGLEALRTACAGLQAQAQAQILALQVQVLKYDILAAKAEAAQAVANAALEPLESQLNAFPTNITRYVASCTSLGDLVTAPSQILSNIRSVANGAALRAREIVSFSEELGAVQQELESLVELLGSVIDVAEQIIIEKTSPPQA